MKILINSKKKFKKCVPCILFHVLVSVPAFHVPACNVLGFSATLPKLREPKLIMQIAYQACEQNLGSTESSTECANHLGGYEASIAQEFFLYFAARIWHFEGSSIAFIKHLLLSITASWDTDVLSS